MARRAGGGSGSFAFNLEELEGLTLAEQESMSKLLWGDEEDDDDFAHLWAQLQRAISGALALVARLLRATLALDDPLRADGGGGDGGDQNVPPPKAPAPHDSGSTGAAAAFAALGLNVATADVAAVESAYRRLSLSCHPDKHPDDELAAAKFGALTQARDQALAFICSDGDAASAARCDSYSEQQRHEEKREKQRARAAHEAMRRAEEARLRRAGGVAAAVAAALAGEQTPAAFAQAARAAWEALMAHMAEQRDAERSAVLGSSNAARRAAAEIDAPAARARRHAAALAALGPPPDPADATVNMLNTPAGAYMASGVSMAVCMRARAELHLFQHLQLCASAGITAAALRESCGAGTTPLHHAAHVGLRAGVELLVRFAGIGYSELVLLRDANGATPLDVARARAQQAAACADGDAMAAERAVVLARLEMLTAAALAARAALRMRILRGVVTMPVRLLRGGWRLFS